MRNPNGEFGPCFLAVRSPLTLSEPRTAKKAVSVPRWVLGLGHGHFYSILLALSFGSTISPGFFGFYSKGIPMAHASFCPPHPERNGAMGFQNLALVDDVALIGVDEGLCLLWSSILCSPCLTAACLVALRCRLIFGLRQLR